MGKGDVNIILSVDKQIGGKDRKAGAILLQGQSARGFSADDINKAIQLGQVKAVQTKEDQEEEKKGHEEGAE